MLLLWVYFVLVLWLYLIIFFHLCIKLISWQPPEFKLCQKFRSKIIFVQNLLASVISTEGLRLLNPCLPPSLRNMKISENWKFSGQPRTYCCARHCMLRWLLLSGARRHLLFQRLEFDFLCYHAAQCILAVWMIEWKLEPCCPVTYPADNRVRQGPTSSTFLYIMSLKTKKIEMFCHILFHKRNIFFTAWIDN